MGHKSRKEYLLAIWARYQRVGRRFKSKILDEFCSVCGYSRKYAIGLLRRKPTQRTKKPGPKPKYDAEVLAPLKAMWLASEQMCSKRLKAALPIWLPFYEQQHGVVSEPARTKLLKISPATIDRLLKKVRARYWVYGGTCFRLSQRVQTQSGRSLILSRGTVMTRGGVDALKEQLWAEAMRHGLSQAQEVLVIADGAVWIWNLVADRFSGARQRLDPWHALQHLWTVAHALHPEDEVAAAAWIKPLKEKLLESQALEVITELDQLLKRLQGSCREVVQTQRDYLENNKNRLDYKGAHERGEPLGSGAMESTCRQYQVRFHRSGQFWTTQGDEALMCLETFWRNARWRLLFPHVPADFDPSKN